MKQAVDGDVTNRRDAKSNKNGNGNTSKSASNNRDSEQSWVHRWLAFANGFHKLERNTTI
jgi:hypothetical protein